MVRTITAIFADGHVDRIRTESSYTHAYRVMSSRGSSMGWARSAAAALDAGNLSLNLARRNGDLEAELEIVEAVADNARIAA
jgi:hypothetical protein